MQKIIQILILLKLIIYTDSANNDFCSTLCNSQACWGTGQDKCSTCTTGFIKNSGSPVDYCVTNPNLFFAQTQKYQPIGKTSDLVKDLQSNLTVDLLVVNGSTLTGSCSGSGKSYTFYGKLTQSSVLTVTHPGISNVVYFWKVRILYWVITIDDFNNPANVKTKFLGNLTQAPAVTRIDKDNNQMWDKKDVCDDDEDQRYKVINHQFALNDSSIGPLIFQISLHNTVTSNKWGVKGIVVALRYCHPYCLICQDDTTTKCLQCDFPGYNALLSGTTCALTCLSGYGNDTLGDNSICIKCAANCSSCLNYNTSCTKCNGGYYLYNDGITLNTIACLLDCPAHYFKNSTANPMQCQICDITCGNCATIPTKCISCPLNIYLYNFTCVTICPIGTFPNSITWICAACNILCTQCLGPSTNCTVCNTIAPNVAYLLNSSCLINCGPGYFQDTSGGFGPNLCTSCAPQCLTCEFNSTYCYTCAVGFYLYNNTCNSTCPIDYFASNITWTCLNCKIYCVGLKLVPYFDSNLKNVLILDMVFSENLNWTGADAQAFMTITQNDPILDINIHFDLVWSVVSPKVYRVQIKPKGYIFIYNVTFKFTTIPFPGNGSTNPKHRSINYLPFKQINFDLVATTVWFLIKTPSLTDTQAAIIDTVSKFSDQVSALTTNPYIQEIKKTGIFALLLGGAQATSTACLVNTIPSQNFYEGVRFWGSFIFFDVPQWEQNSDKTKFFVVPSVDQMIKNARRLQSRNDDNNNQNPSFQQNTSRKLFDTSSLEWRFQRTGHTSFFIFDVYMNIILIVICWILLIVGHYCISHKIRYAQYMGKFYSFTHKVHEISIFYITLSTLLQWIYFDSNSVQRWISLGLCAFCNLYFLAYQLYIYYDMISYPKAKIGGKEYEYYTLKYGSLIKNIRFQEYDPTQPWTFRHWFRPYNYHILSYYKKFLMMIALPIFYDIPHAQISALIAIQVFQILRLLITWPFLSKIRNFIRFGLDLLLLMFFITVIIQQYMVIQIIKNDAVTLSNAINIFYKTGWAGFCAVFIFNIGYLIIVIYDIVIGCRTSNRQMMDQARKTYYMQKISKYEQQNQDLPLQLLNKWVKLGNLNNRNYQQLPDVNLRIQYFKISKTQNNGYIIQMKMISDVFMNIQFNYQKQFNLTTVKKIQKQFTLKKQISPDFYHLIDQLYKKYNSRINFQYMTIKTFQKVIQSNLSPGQKVILNNQEMFQRIQLETQAGQIKTINLDKILPGFPLSKDILIHLV